MTLGTAASRSITNASASEMRCGASSARKMAAPTPRGTARTSATIEVTTVPYKNGNAPKCSKTGSQALVAKNFQPKAWREALEFTQSTYRSRLVRRITPAAKTSVRMWAISSPLRNRSISWRALPGKAGKGPLESVELEEAVIFFLLRLDLRYVLAIDRNDGVW